MIDLEYSEVGVWSWRLHIRYALYIFIIDMTTEATVKKYLCVLTNFC